MIIKDLRKRILTSLILLFLIFLIIKFNFILVYSLIVLGVVSCLEFFNIIKKIFNNKYYLLTYNLLFIIYVFIFSLLFFFFSNILQLKIILFTLLFGCIASDIGGFIFGKIFKGPKLTKISPNKTISGSLGSFIFSCITIALIFYYYTENTNINILIIGLITSLFCQLGDLFFSFLKRKAKIKDTGNFLPGHGGALDRVDGIFLGIPFGFMALAILY
jgi:phosphatidate cytidylyltransferase